MLEPGVSAGGEDASGLTLTGFNSSFAGAVAVEFEVCFAVGAGDGASSSGVSGAKRARTLLGNFRRTILLALDPLLGRFDDGGVETLPRPLDARRIALLVFAGGGMVTRCCRVSISMALSEQRRRCGCLVDGRWVEPL